ncbi:MAG: exosome complex RNA-binding protein Rrp4 [Caldivirga sp.]|jgi:ribosomal RNA-processing protein RRP4 (EC 3.1.13.-)|uniref:exosome complex RNA-binding protein Rrp4 n=1 Tax=Caldivirga sp. MU80 TaxID=1650354 RepID=UPI0007474378|nr:exosome complex RNA-binding protein Rrp4 [Caldivirga sp. MU80]KUO86129.1 MAG: RNA-binding protein [Caldivirga sp. CIS_19]
MLNVTDRMIVLPGDLIGGRSNDYVIVGSVYWEGDKAYAATVATINIKGDVKPMEVQVIPLNGTYKPRQGDAVIGYVVDILVNGWEVDIKSPYSAYLPVNEATLKPVDVVTADLRNILNIGDVVLAKISDFNLAKDYPVTLTIKESRLGRIEDGTIVEIDPVKVPRVIGKKGSMVNMFKDELNCDVTVGQNGRIWVRCRNRRDEVFVSQTIKFIERESHQSGLMDRVKAIIQSYKSATTGAAAQSQ